MPVVMVNRGNKIRLKQFLSLIDALPNIIAEALTCNNPDGKLFPKDIKVWVRESNMLDIGTDQLQIMVFSGLYPERLANRDKREKLIKEEIAGMLPPDVNGWVWIIMADNLFGEF